MDSKQIDILLVNKEASIKEAMQAIDRGSLGIAFIVDRNKKLFGVVTDGDVRRAVFSGVNIKKPIKVITNKKPIVIEGRISQKEMLNLKKRKDIIFISVNDKNNFQHVDKKPRLIRSGVKRVLITGGAGYLGSVLSRKLIKAGYRVRVLDNLTYGDEGIKELYQNKNFEFFKGDVRNISQIMHAVRGMDAVIHLSAIVGDAASQIDSKETIEINYLSAKAVAEACKFNQINKFLFASTCSVYGANKSPKELLNENSPLHPVSLYAETKLTSEEGILSLADENFSPTIFRFATLFGVSPRMRFDLVVNVMTANAVTENKVRVFGGSQWRPNLDVSDAAEACITWVASPIEKTGGQVFNVGANSHNIQIVNIAGMIKKIMPEITIEHNTTSIDQRDYNVSFDKISMVLGFKPQKKIEHGIREIKKILENKTIKNFNSHQYHNYGFLAQSKHSADNAHSSPTQHYKS